MPTRELPSLMAICLVGTAVMSDGMYTLASVYAWVFIGASVLAVFGYLMLRLWPPTVFQGGSVEEDAVPWNRNTCSSRETVARYDGNQLAVPSTPGQRMRVVPSVWN